LYEEREKRFNDAIALKKPDRVPILALFSLMTAKHEGFSYEEDMSRLEKHLEGNFKTNLDFQPDLASPPLFFGPILEALDFKQLKWPGHGVASDASFQFVEGDYMKAEEYDAFLFDPSDFMLRKYWPRVMGKLKVFELLPPLNQIISFYMGVNIGFMAFGFPEAAEALRALASAGQSTLAALTAGMAHAQRLREAGFPLYFTACTQAPFDTLGDYFRGTKGIMIDMHRKPDKVTQACEKLLPIMFDYAVAAARISGNARVLIPLHKGAESFMSLEQYKKFYWPTFRELMIGLINEGLVPVVMFQGGYTSRLDIIKDIPAGKACYWLESVDLDKARETLGGRVCIKGLLPMSLLVAGNVDEVRSYCKKLIDTLGKDGGYIMGPAAGSLEDANLENVRAMFEFTREYGVY
jgi:hypothetical protein